MADVIPFSRRPQSVEELLHTNAHLSEAERFDRLHQHVATAMGMNDDFAQANEWVGEAILHLKQMSSGHTTGGVEVSVAGLHLALGYIEHLEGRLCIIPQLPGAA